MVALRTQGEPHRELRVHLRVEEVRAIMAALAGVMPSSHTGPTLVCEASFGTREVPSNKVRRILLKKAIFKGVPCLRTVCEDREGVTSYTFMGQALLLSIVAGTPIVMDRQEYLAVAYTPEDGVYDEGLPHSDATLGQGDPQRRVLH